MALIQRSTTTAVFTISIRMFTPPPEYVIPAPVPLHPIELPSPLSILNSRFVDLEGESRAVE